MNLDYYKILGVNKSSSSEEIKSAYKNLAKKYHPDKNDGEELSTEIFKKVKEAYEILSDSDKKYLYDNKQEYKQSAQSTHKTKPQYQKKSNPKYKEISNKRASLYAFGFVLIIGIGASLLYPIINQWASNDKYETALTMVNNENWDEAYVYTSAAITQWDENGRAYLLRGKIVSGVFKKYNSALADFNMAFNLLPKDSIQGSDYYMRAKCYHELGKTNQACEDLKTASLKGFKRAAEDIAIICK